MIMDDNTIYIIQRQLFMYLTGHRELTVPTESEVFGNNALALVRRCEELLSDDSLNSNRKFRLAVKENPKGFVDFQLFLDDPIIKDILSESGIFNKENQQMILRRSVWENSSHLKCSWKQIRRTVPYVDKIKEKKPVFIESLPSTWNKQQLLEVLGIQCEIYCTLFKQQSGIFYALIYCADPNEVHSKKYEMSKKYNINIFNYTAYIANKESYLAIRGSQINPQIKNQGFEEFFSVYREDQNKLDVEEYLLQEQSDQEQIRRPERKRNPYRRELEMRMAQNYVQLQYQYKANTKIVQSQGKPHGVFNFNNFEELEKR